MWIEFASKKLDGGIYEAYIQKFQIFNIMPDEILDRMSEIAADKLESTKEQLKT